MAAPATGQPNLGAGQSILLQDSSFPPLNQIYIGESNLNLPNDCRRITNNNACVLKTHNFNQGQKAGIDPIPMKQLSYNNGTPRIVWTEEEVNKMNILEDLQYAVIGKF
ncbi:hypothetical protein H5410_026451 [Solanum commersonii]|uniref:Uncharacterized protein n=1 Tax=Solanum commersonii TaxID=4109 RepID=A0A9J5YZ19_SOLCO|nr:hypothetical protein H5410_026451 [Solanum commersonii]